MKEIKALLRFAKPYAWFLVLATMSMIAVTGMNLLAPWMIRNLISTVTGEALTEESFKRISLLTITTIIVYLLRAISQFGSDYVSHYAAWKILENIRQHLYDHIQNLSLRYFQNKQTGDLMSIIINDTRNFEHLLAHAIPTVIVNGIMIFGVSAILFSININLALYTLIPIPVLVWIVLKFSKTSRSRFKDAQVKIGEVNSILQDNFSGIKEIKAFTHEDYESRRTGESISEHTNAILKAVRLSNAVHPGIGFVSSIGTVIVIFFGGRLALTGVLPLEDLVAFLLYLSSFYQPITALGNIYEGLQQALASAERVLEVLAEEPEVKEDPNPIKLQNVKGRIEFCNVDFHYVDNIPVLKNISFKVNPGETLAIVGPTGVGKTTITSLILRFFDPISGNILVDDIDIRRVSLSNLRRHISLVSQDVFLFNGTVKENILYGRLDATDDEVIAAAKAANAHDFILELPDGYNTKVGERGVKLSGGQKQRISIARAILKNAPILILDEATSSVDTQTEKLIQDALNKLKKNRTTIIIAHRLSTIQDADHIIVMKDGYIIERGTHEELLELNGLYSELCKTQDTLQKQLPVEEMLYI